MLDSNGQVKDSISYDAFGNIVAESAPAYRGRYAWTGRELDSETGVQFNRGRYYDPQTGRWMSQDPLGFAAGDSNLYRYAGDNPNAGTDPSGFALPGHSFTNVGKNGRYMRAATPRERRQIGGVVQAGFGVLETIIGVLAAPETGGAGVFLAFHGVDNWRAGLLTAITGEQHHTITFEWIKTQLVMNGYSEKDAEEWAGYTEWAAVIIAGAAATTPEGEAPKAAPIGPAKNVAGMNSSQAQELEGILSKTPGVKQVRVFGSRTKGTSGPNSDLDVTLIGKIDRDAPATLNQIRKAQDFARRLGFGKGLKPGEGAPLDIHTFESETEFYNSFKNDPNFDPREGVFD